MGGRIQLGQGDYPVISRGSIGVAVASLLVSLLISAILTPIVRRWASRREFVDRPGPVDSYKKHKVPTPYGGGIAITVAILVPMAAMVLAGVAFKHIEPNQIHAFTNWLPHWPHWLGGVAIKIPVALAIIAGALVMHLMGIIDDHYPLSPYFKLFIQAVVALMLTAGFKIRVLEFLGPVPAVILTMVWIVALTNAFNFMDNMDGLSAGVAALTAIMLALTSLLAGQVFVPCMLLLVAGAVLGFLIYNFPPATIFMGDAGSLVVGYMLAVSVVLVTFYNPGQDREPFGVFVPLVIFAVPIYDMGSVMIHRLRSGASVFHPDRRHFSHRLVKLGMSPTAAVLTIYLATTATAMPAILLPFLHWAGAVLIFGQCVCVVALIAVLESRDAS